MARCARRWLIFLSLALLSLFSLLHVFPPGSQSGRLPIGRLHRPSFVKPKLRWADIPLRHPVQNYTTLPVGPLKEIPRVQARSREGTRQAKAIQHERLDAVKEAFVHSWEGYKLHAWLHDEVTPLTGGQKSDYGGWGATLVDSLDTLWIMGLNDEFDMAVTTLEAIDFSTSELLELNVFETTIRYLGGLLSAYDVSGKRHPVLLEKAVELGDMLYMAFDTPNRTPVTRWDWQNAASGGEQVSNSHTLAAEVGSMTLEFTRLSQLTGNPKYYDAVARVTNLLADWQHHTRSPGLWPVYVNTAKPDLHQGRVFTLGGMADSLYEYLPKQYLLLGGRSEQYRKMYEIALSAAKETLFFRPLNPENDQILLSGSMKQNSPSSGHFTAEAQHLTCFVGGMVALAARIFDEESDLETARQLTEGCIWAYDSMPSGIMPEKFRAVACGENRDNNCTWSERDWHHAIEKQSLWDDDGNPAGEQAQALIQERHLPPGMTSIPDSRYMLRPEAIESVFVLYRITGDEALREKAWSMFQAVTSHTRTKIGFASISDVTQPDSPLIDSMESFWTAETLKYFYLIFSDPDLISLDEYVFNTEAHPLLRPVS